jgi:hypothetical protein
MEGVAMSGKNKPLISAEAQKMIDEALNKTAFPPKGVPPYNYYGFEAYNAAEAARIHNWAIKRYGYVYAYPQAKGVIMVVAVPNPKAFEDRTKPKIIHGLRELGESEAIEALAFAQGEVDKKYRKDLDVLLNRLYLDGYALCKRENQEVKPK